MDRFLDEMSKRFGIDIIFKKACDTADESLKRYEQLMYKKLDKNKDGEINGNICSKWARKC